MSEIRVIAAIKTGGLAVVAFAEYDSDNNPISICYAVFSGGACLGCYPTIEGALAHLQVELKRAGKSIDDEFLVIDQRANAKSHTGLKWAIRAIQLILEILLALLLPMCEAPSEELEQIYRESNYFSLPAAEQGIGPRPTEIGQFEPKMEPS